MGERDEAEQLQLPLEVREPPCRRRASPRPQGGDRRKPGHRAPGRIGHNAGHGSITTTSSVRAAGYDPAINHHHRRSTATMNRTVRAAALSTAAVLLLAACSGASESADEPTDASSEVTASEVGDPGEEGGAEMDEENLVYEQGTFAAQNDTGAEFKIEIPAEAPADIEELREAVGEDPVGYIKIEIDNTNGTENAGPSDVHLVDENGNQHSYTSAFVVIGDWGPSMRDDGPEDVNDGYWYAMPDGSEITEDEYDALNTQANDLYNAHLENDAMPRAKATAYYIGPEVPEKFLYVEVQEAMVPYIAEPAA